MTGISENTVKSSNRLVRGLVSAVIDAQTVLDSNHTKAKRRVEEHTQSLVANGSFNHEGMDNAASALTPLHLTINNTRVQARVYFSQTERKDARVGVGIVATPIEAYFEASFGSTEETESSIHLEIQQVSLAQLRGHETGESNP